MKPKERLLFERIVDAAKIVSKHTIETPVVYSKVLSEAIGEQVSLKLEKSTNNRELQNQGCYQRNIKSYSSTESGRSCLRYLRGIMEGAWLMPLI